mgnify:FL=1
MSKEAYLESLSNGVRTVTFTKVDGTERVMEATIQPKILKEIYGDQATALQRNPDTLTVFDTEKKDWRSIRVSSIKTLV